jgi:hypothetical protein
MKNNNLQETVVACILIVLLVAILNPFNWWMPTMLHMAMLAGALVAFSAFAIFVFRERVIDEREDVHRMLAGHAAFLFGAAVLIVGILYQSYMHVLDVWLIVVLVGMVLAKVGARFYSDQHH